MSEEKKLAKADLESGAGEVSHSVLAETVALAPGESREQTLFGTKRLIPYEGVPESSGKNDVEYNRSLEDPAPATTGLQYPDRLDDHASQAPWMNDKPGAPVKVVFQEKKSMSGFNSPRPVYDESTEKAYATQAALAAQAAIRRKPKLKE
jgi:hypothetical protein